MLFLTWTLIRVQSQIVRNKKKSKIHHNRDSKSQMYQDVSKELSLYGTLRGDPLPDTMVTLLKEFYSVDYTDFSNTF